MLLILMLLYVIFLMNQCHYENRKNYVFTLYLNQSYLSLTYELCVCIIFESMISITHVFTKVPGSYKVSGY